MIIEQWQYDYYTKDKCVELAQACNNIQNFRKFYKNYAYFIAHEKGWWLDLCSFMEGTKPAGYWTKELCYFEALKYTSRKEYRIKSSSSFYFASRKKWLKEICSHMKIPVSSRLIWTKEKCYELALKCETKKEFSEKYHKAWAAARRNSWFDEICSHMKIIGNLYNRMIYAFEFSDNHVYIGLTSNSKKRHSEHTIHNKKTSVSEHIKNTNLFPKYIELTDYICIEDAIKLEEKFLEDYLNKKWVILNKNKTGALGKYKIIWTDDALKQEALKYTYKAEFEKNNDSAFTTAYKRGILNEICSHMVNGNKLRADRDRKWTYETCKIAALECKTRKEFQNKYSAGYNLSNKEKWLNELCSHMTAKNKPHRYWTKERCHELSLKCKTRKEFERMSGGACNSARKNKWIDDFFPK